MNLNFMKYYQFFLQQIVLTEVRIFVFQLNLQSENALGITLKWHAYYYYATNVKDYTDLTTYENEADTTHSRKIWRIKRAH